MLLRGLLLVASLITRLWLMVHGAWVSVPLLLVLDLITELVVFVALVAVFFSVVIFVLVLIFFVLFIIILIFLKLLATATGDDFLFHGHTTVAVGRAATCTRSSLLLALHLLAHRLLLLIDQIVHRHYRLPSGRLALARSIIAMLHGGHSTSCRLLLLGLGSLLVLLRLRGALVHDLGVLTNRETGLHHHGRIIHFTYRVMVLASSRGGSTSGGCCSAALLRLDTLGADDAIIG